MTGTPTLQALLTRCAAEDLHGRYKTRREPNPTGPQSLWSAEIKVEGARHSWIKGYGPTRDEALDLVAGWVIKALWPPPVDPKTQALPIGLVAK